MSEAMATFFTFLLLLSYAGLTVSQGSVRFVREANLPADDFLLPRDTPVCSRKGGPSYIPECQNYKATSLGGCWCQCGKVSSPEIKTFYEPSNSCVLVSVARKDAGMSVIHQCCAS